jgi:hypothetical protein
VKTDESQNVVPYIENFIRTASEVSGFNLLPYFERFGFLTVGAFEIDDYGKRPYRLTEQRLNEFRKEMQQTAKHRKLKTMPEGMVERIAMTK